MSGTTSTLHGVWAAASNRAYAVLHYDGSTWSIQDTGIQSFGLLDLWGSSATDVYVVGGGGNVVHGTP